jgi:hypothetical protein
MYNVYAKLKLKGIEGNGLVLAEIYNFGANI